MLGLNRLNRPFFMLSVEGAEGAALNSRVMGITLTENRGFESDTLNITIDDADGLVVLPETGATITLSIGFPLVSKGEFIVDSVTHQGPPDQILIGAHSAGFKEKITERKSYAFHDMTIKEIVEEIANDHGFKAAISEPLGAIKIEHRLQADESDANFLTRLAQEFDAIAALKQGTLLFIEKGEGKTASGKSLPTIIHQRSDGDKHSYAITDREQYSGVEVRYLPEGSAKRERVVVGEEERLFRMRTIYNNREEAEEAGERKLQALSRGERSAQFNLAVGNARLTADSPLIVQGFKAEIDAQTWVVSRITHNITTQNGYTNEISAEVMPSQSQ